MKTNNIIINKIFIEKYKFIYICISSIITYSLLSFMSNIEIASIFRIYYMIFSFALFILLKYTRKFDEKYVYKIIYMFFSLIIVVSILGFAVNIKQENNFFINIKYINLSNEIMLLLEMFISYTLSEYYLKNKEFKKLPYIMFFLAIVTMILIHNFEVTFIYIKLIFFIIEILLFVNIFINLQNSNNSNKNQWNIIKCYTALTTLRGTAYIYGFYFDINETLNIINEVMQLICFRVIWNVVLVNSVRDPYRELSNSLNNENRELDELNEKIFIKNEQLEKSIDLLKNKEYLNATFFMFMPHPIIILNAKNNRILFVNKQFLKLIETNSSRNIINERIDKYINFLSNCEKNINYNAILKFKDNKKFIYAKLLEQHSDENKKLILIKDNTYIVKKEQIGKKVKNKKMEENLRTQFLSSISHDLKTPINVIYSASQVEKIYIEKHNVDGLRKYNSICKQNCISLIKLTNNLIDNSQITSDYLKPRLNKSNIVEIIEDNVMSLVEYVKWNSITLIFDTNIEECYLNIDQEFMERIMLNLVSNAVKFTEKNGRIYVIIHDSKNFVEVSIKDNGIGMSDEFVDKAFNRYAVEENGDNDLKVESGIGLFVVKQLVELQGGSIRIESELNVGTNIIMQFKKENENDNV